METDKQKIRELLEKFFEKMVDKIDMEKLLTEMYYREYYRSVFWNLEFEEKSLDILRPTLQDMVMKNHDTQKPLKLWDSL